MKKIVFFINLWLVALCAPIMHALPDNNYMPVIVIMAKNEAPFVEPTLKPYVEAGIDRIIFYDTGSTDGSREIAQHFFTQNNVVHGHVIEEPFVDFATSRNRALEHAQRIFPDAIFMLMPDAEWYMHGADKLVQFCRDYQNHTDSSYFVYIQSTHLGFVTPRLIRCNRNVHFVGAVHEILNTASHVTVPRECYFEWRPSAKGQAKSAERWKRDRDILLREHEKDPTNARTIFYLAQTLELLGEYENAYAFYQKRAAMQGPNEDHYITLFRMGNVAQQIVDTQSSIIPLPVKHYLEAFNTRPQRAEPLIKIAQYYLSRHMMDLAFLFAQRACHIPFPKEDRLPVEKYMYEFTRYDVLGICAWYVDEFEVGEWAVRKALESNTQAPHLHTNLRLYTERKQKRSRRMTAATAA